MDDDGTEAVLPVVIAKTGLPELMNKAELLTRQARTEQRVVEVVGLLAGLVGRLRTPLLLVSLIPAVPAAVLLLLAVTSRSWFPGVVALIGLIPSVWLTVRRRQLVEALQPPELAVAELRATFNTRQLSSQLKDNLLAMRGHKIRLRPGALAGSVWRGVKVTADLHSRFTEVPRLAPFLPGRLRGLGLLCLSCIVAGVALAGIAILGLLVSSLIFFGG